MSFFFVVFFRNEPRIRGHHSEFFHHFDQSDYLAKDYTESERAHLEGRLDALTSAIVKKLLHQPTAYLRDLKNPSELELVKKIFTVVEHRSNSTRRHSNIPGNDQELHD